MPSGSHLSNKYRLTVAYGMYHYNLGSWMSEAAKVCLAGRHLTKKIFIDLVQVKN